MAKFQASCALWVLAAALATPASAQEASGTFRGYITSGVAQEPTGSDPNPPSIAGEQIFGTFQFTFQPPLVLLGTASPAGAYYFDDMQPAFAWSVSIPAQGISVIDNGLDFAATGLGVTESPKAQSIDITADADEGFQSFEMVLAATPGALFSGIDPTTIHPGTVDLLNSRIIFGEKEGPLHFDAVFTQIAFTSPVPVISNAVPEPSTYRLMFAGLLTIGWLVWRRRRPNGLDAVH